MIQSVWKNLTVCRNPAEHFWCDFKCRPWAKNSSPNTNDLYIHYMDKSTGTLPSLEEKEALPNCGNKDGNIIHVLKNYISTSVATVSKWLYPYVPIYHWCLVMNTCKLLIRLLITYTGHFLYLNWLILTVDTENYAWDFSRESVPFLIAILTVSACII